MKPKHTATYRGRWVSVRLTTGESFRARFLERTRSKIVIFDNGRRIPVSQIVEFLAGTHIARAKGLA